MKKHLLLLMAILLVLASGCTGSAPPAEPTPVPTLSKTAVPTYHPTTSVATVVRTASVDDNTITITRSGFSPSAITVKRDATVRWVNADSTEDPNLYNPTHRIKLGTIKTSPVLSPSQSWSWRFTTLGVFDYSDVVHPDLTGTIAVV